MCVTATLPSASATLECWELLNALALALCYLRASLMDGTLTRHVNLSASTASASWFVLEAIPASQPATSQDPAPAAAATSILYRSLARHCKQHANHRISRQISSNFVNSGAARLQPGHRGYAHEDVCRPVPRAREPSCEMLIRAPNAGSSDLSLRSDTTRTMRSNYGTRQCPMTSRRTPHLHGTTQAFLSCMSGWVGAALLSHASRRVLCMCAATDSFRKPEKIQPNAYLTMDASSY